MKLTFAIMNQKEVVTSRPRTSLIMARGHTFPFALNMLLLTLLLVSPCCIAKETKQKVNPPKLLLISLDGFGWNFLGKLPKAQVPNFEAFIEKGVHVRWVENVFPTTTRPNHMSLVSGLYPESHGIVDNVFYDPLLEGSMPRGALKDNDSKWVDVGAEPIWVTNSKAGEGRRSGTIYWPCADAKIKGRLPEEIRRGEWIVNDTEVTPYQRIDWALDWLTGETTEPVNFVAAHTNGPDTVSQAYGPDSQELLDKIVAFDGLVKYLLTKMQEKHLEHELNVVITADHGHFPVYQQLVINLDLLLDPSWYIIYSQLEHGAPMVNLWPRKDIRKVMKALKDKHRNLHVAMKTDSHDLRELHYTASHRIAPIVLWAETGWVIGNNKTRLTNGKGRHGWDPRYSPYMYPFFVAVGPAFKRGVRNAKPFHIVDMYPLMCHILGLEPAPNNGSLNRTHHILVPPPAPVPLVVEEEDYTGVGIGIVVSIVAVIVILILVRYMKNNRKYIFSVYDQTFDKTHSANELIEDESMVLRDEEL